MSNGAAAAIPTRKGPRPGDNFGGVSHRVRTSWWTSRLAIAISFPLLFFVALRPERFSLTPNRSDPIFYLGYSINFDDVMRELGDHRYFVTRWSSYLPNRLFSFLLGPFVGRLVLRWLVASAVLICLLHLGRRWSWTRTTEIVVCVVALANPLFARAFMTEYVEWFVVAVGVILICQCLELRATACRSAAVGCFAALLVVSNPIAAAIALPPLAVYIVAAQRRGAAWVAHALIVSSASATTFMVGWAWFKYAQDVPNVYQPTIDFLRAYAGAHDPHKSPRLEWMELFLWIYAPAVLVVATAGIGALRRSIVADHVVLAAMMLLVLQYLFQWIDQFVRDGVSLEVAYYWSMIAPTMLVATAILCGRAPWRRVSIAIFVTAWVGVLAISRWLETLSIPVGAQFALVSASVVTLCVLLARRSITAAIGSLAIFLLMCQTLAPKYDPSAYHRYNDSPDYRHAFFVANGSTADRDLEEAVWLTRRLDELPSDADLYFAPSAAATNITAVYVPHVTRHLMRSTPGVGLGEESVDLIRLGRVRLLAVYGDSEFVSTTVQALEAVGVPNGVVLDAVNPHGYGRELAVLEFRIASEGFEWAAVELLSRTGRADENGRFAVPGEDVAGFLLHGPYLALRDGAWGGVMSGPSS